MSHTMRVPTIHATGPSMPMPAATTRPRNAETRKIAARMRNVIARSP